MSYVPLAVALGCGGDDTGGNSGSATSTATGSAGTDTDDTTSSGGSDPTTNDPTTNDPTTNDPTTSDPTTNSTSTSGSTSETDSGSDTGNGQPPAAGVAIDNGTSPSSLFAVDLATGTGQRVCDMAPNTTYDSITFRRNGTFLVHNVQQDRIETVDPCDCGFQIVGPTSIGTLEMTVDEDSGLLGINLTYDAFLTINPNTGLASVVGSLGIVVDAGAIAWSDADQVARVLDATADQLLIVDRMTGLAGMPVALSDAVSNPGMDYDNATDTLYACSGDDLLTIDPTDGTVTVVGSIGLTGACTNLGIPFEGIACLE
jgi:hypothetical protein